MNDNVDSVVRWAVIENIVTLILFAAIVIFAPGEWKWFGVALLLNLNYFKKRKSDTPNKEIASSSGAANGSIPADAGKEAR